jgi:hypothetical protein
MSKVVRALLAAMLLSGCAVSHRPSHESPLMAVYATGWKCGEGADELRRYASWFEDALVLMAEDFRIPLDEVIPVRVYVEKDSSQRSYYNRITRSIVLRGELDPLAFVHELSHLFAHRIRRFPPYWSDQALAEYMEGLFAGPRSQATQLLASGGRSRLTADPDHGQRTRHLIRRIAQARDPREVMAHLTPRAVDEEPSWGLMLVRYLFEDRWLDRPMPERIRRLLALTDQEVAALAPEVLAWCRRPELLSDDGDPPAG